MLTHPMHPHSMGFGSMRSRILHPRDQLVAIMNRIYRNGMTTLSGGNLSIRDDDDSIWITPAGVRQGQAEPTRHHLRKGGRPRDRPAQPVIRAAVSPRDL